MQLPTLVRVRASHFNLVPHPYSSLSHPTQQLRPLCAGSVGHPFFPKPPNLRPAASVEDLFPATDLPPRRTAAPVAALVRRTTWRCCRPSCQRRRPLRLAAEKLPPSWPVSRSLDKYLDVMPWLLLAPARCTANGRTTSAPTDRSSAAPASAPPITGVVV
jgi:hypothetical protein